LFQFLFLIDEQIYYFIMNHIININKLNENGFDKF